MSHQTSLSSGPSQHIINARAQLLTSGFYLGSPKIRENVEWVRDGTARRLCEKTPDLEDPDQPPTSHELATISTVVTISPDNFWLRPENNWKGPSQYNPTLADVKATCIGNKPNMELFQDNFEETIQNIEWLQNESAVVSFKDKCSIIVNNDGVPGIKFRHICISKQ
jgi:hypothetical protein